MDFGWIISGPGSTWVNKDYSLVRNPQQAHIFHDPVKAFADLKSAYKPDFKWKLHKLTSELVAYSGEGAWLPY